VARPLREQFAIATFVLIVPVGAVMAFTGYSTYRDELDVSRQDAENIAKDRCRAYRQRRAWR
jgi:hypothetical protein